MAYMEMFGNCSQPNTSEYLRHSVHTYSLLQAEWQQHELTLSSTQSCSFTHHFTPRQSGNSVSSLSVLHSPARSLSTSHPGQYIYTEMPGNCSQPNSEHLCHSVHTYSLLQAEWQQCELTLSSTQSCSFTLHFTPRSVYIHRDAWQLLTAQYHEYLCHSVHTYSLLQAEWQQCELTLSSTQSCSFTLHFTPSPIVSTCVTLYTHTAYCRQSGNSVSSLSVLHSPARSLTTSHPGQYIYTEMPGNCSQPSTSEYLCHSVHTYSLLQAEWQQHELTLSSTQSCSFTHHFTPRQSGNSVSSLSVLHSPARSLTTSHPGQYIYTEMPGNCSQPSTSEYLCHSVHTYSLLQAEWQQHELTLSSTQSCSFAHHFTPRQSGNSVSSLSVLHSPARSLTTSHPGQYIYTEMPGNCSQPSTSEYLCHSVHTYSLLQAEWQQHELTLSSTQSCSFAHHFTPRQSGNSVSSLSVLHSPARSLTTSHPGQYIYTEMPGNCSQPSTSEYLCHSVHTYSLLQAEWQQHELTLSSTQSCSFTHHFTPSLLQAEWQQCELTLSSTQSCSFTHHFTPSTIEYLCHSVHTYSLLQAEWQQCELTLSSTQSCSFTLHFTPSPIVSTCVTLYTHTAYCRQSGNSVSSPSVLHSPARSLTTSHPGQFIYTEMPGNCSQPSTSEYHSVLYWRNISGVPKYKMRRNDSVLDFLVRYHEEGDAVLENIVTGDETWDLHFVIQTQNLITSFCWEQIDHMLYRQPELSVYIERLSLRFTTDDEVKEAVKDWLSSQAGDYNIGIQKLVECCDRCLLIVSPSPALERLDTPPALPPKQRDRQNSAATSPPSVSPVPAPLKEVEEKVRPGASTGSRLLLPLTPTPNGSQLAPDSPLDMLDVTQLLVLKKTDEEGPDIRGGHPDALIIHATKANKNGKSKF
ncbi:Rap guanine nucleotide exchange factor 1 [Homalodisca vitripennis]|nr:Rap guanine nucleotide exchange factor 1 [Homalodisca vitripennis]